MNDQDEGVENVEIPVLYEKFPSSKIENDAVSFCDKRDLLAVKEQSTGDVVVYRLNGEVAFVVKGRGEEDNACVVKWKEGGTLLGKTTTPTLLRKLFLWSRDIGNADAGCIKVWAGEVGLCPFIRANRESFSPR